MKTVNAVLENILETMGLEISNDDLVQHKGVDVVMGGYPISIWSKEYTNTEDPVNFWNPFSEAPLRGDSASLLLVKNRLGKTLSMAMLKIVQSTLTVLSGKEPETASTFMTRLIPKDFKIAQRHAKEFRKCMAYAAKEKISILTINTNTNVLYNDEKVLMTMTLSSPFIEMIESKYDEIGIKNTSVPLFVYAIKKLIGKDPVLAGTNELDYTSYDAISRGYNVLVKRFNSVSSGVVANMKDKKLIASIRLKPLPTVDIVVDIDGSKLALDRITPHNDQLVNAEDVEDEFELAERDVDDEFEDIVPDIPKSNKGGSRSIANKSSTRRSGRSLNKPKPTASNMNDVYEQMEELKNQLVELEDRGRGRSERGGRSVGGRGRNERGGRSVGGRGRSSDRSRGARVETVYETDAFGNAIPGTGVERKIAASADTVFDEKTKRGRRGRVDSDYDEYDEMTSREVKALEKRVAAKKRSRQGTNHAVDAFGNVM